MYHSTYIYTVYLFYLCLMPLYSAHCQKTCSLSLLHLFTFALIVSHSYIYVQCMYINIHTYMYVYNTYMYNIIYYLS